VSADGTYIALAVLHKRNRAAVQYAGAALVLTLRLPERFLQGTEQGSYRRFGCPQAHDVTPHTSADDWPHKEMAKGWPDEKV